VIQPSAALQRRIAVDLLEHVEHAARGGVERGVLAERPFQADEVLVIAVNWLSITPRRDDPVLGEIRRIAGGIQDVFAGADHPVVVVALAERDELRPGFVVASSLPGAARTARNDAQRELAVRASLAMAA